MYMKLIFMFCDFGNVIGRYWVINLFIFDFRGKILIILSFDKFFVKIDCSFINMFVYYFYLFYL